MLLIKLHYVKGKELVLVNAAHVSGIRPHPDLRDASVLFLQGQQGGLEIDETVEHVLKMLDAVVLDEASLVTKWVP